LGPVDRLMATGAPTSALANKGGVVEPADDQLSPGGLLLEMAFHAEGGVAFGQELGIDRSVGAMARGAAFAEGFVLEHMRAALAWVASQAALVGRKQGSATGQMGGSLVWIMTVSAREPIGTQRMVAVLGELALGVEVTGETDLGIGARVQNGAFLAP
jgi:hypothetical protein